LLQYVGEFADEYFRPVEATHQITRSWHPLVSLLGVVLLQGGAGHPVLGLAFDAYGERTQIHEEIRATVTVVPYSWRLVDHHRQPGSVAKPTEIPLQFGDDFLFWFSH